MWFPKTVFYRRPIQCSIWMSCCQHPALEQTSPLLFLQGHCLQQPELFSAALKTKSSLSRTLYTNQASAGRMTFLSTLHAKLSSQLIREFLREKRNLWNLLAVEGWISALWSSYGKPITSSSLLQLSFIRLLHCCPSRLYGSRSAGRVEGWGKDRQLCLVHTWSRPGASEPQMHFSCHSECHCCGRNSGSSTSSHTFQSFGCLFLESFSFLTCVVFKLLQVFFIFAAFPQLHLFNIKASEQARLPWHGQGASLLSPSHYFCKGSHETEKQTELRKVLIFRTSYSQQCLNLDCSKRFFLAWFFFVFSFF